MGGLKWVETDLDSLKKYDIVHMKGRLTSTGGDGYRDVALLGIFMGVSYQRYILGGVGVYDSSSFRSNYITKSGTNLLKIDAYNSSGSSSTTLPSGNTWTSNYKFYVLK